MEKKELTKAVRAVTKKRQSAPHVIKEHHASHRMDLQQWIKRKNKLRAKAIMLGINPSDFMLENGIVCPPKVSFPSKEKVTKQKGYQEIKKRV